MYTHRQEIILLKKKYNHLALKHKNPSERVDKFIVKSIITFNKLQKIETVSEMESPQVTPHPEGRSQCSGRASASNAYFSFLFCDKQISC